MIPESRRNDAQPLLWVIGLLLLAVLAVVGGWQCRVLAERAGHAGQVHSVVAQGEPALPGTERAASTPTVGGPLLPAPVRVEERDAAVAFYFAGDQVQVPPDAAKALGAVVKGVAAGQTAVIQAYERSDASPQQTAQRVLSVHNLLVSVGIGEDKIRRAEPEVLPAWAQATKTNRVEVVLDAG